MKLYKTLANYLIEVVVKIEIVLLAFITNNILKTAFLNFRTRFTTIVFDFTPSLIMKKY